MQRMDLTISNFRLANVSLVCTCQVRTAAIGLFSAITPAVAGLASPVLGYCSSSCKTKQPVMILGTMVRPTSNMHFDVLDAGTSCGQYIAVLQIHVDVRVVRSLRL